MKTHMHLIVEKDLKDILGVVAKAQNRSVNNLISTILMEYISGIGEKVVDYLNGWLNLSDEEKAKLMNEYGLNVNKGKKDDR